MVAALLPLVVVLASCTTPIVGNTPLGSQQVGDGAIAPYDLDLYAEVLSTYVDEAGWVDYQGLQANRTGLDQFNASLNAVSPETYADWDEAAQIAFLVNAYNSLTLQSIIDEELLKSSIRDIPGVWRVRRHAILGDTLTLDAIEHDILRKDFNEPRIHAALVCAARSCPPLRPEPYTGESLDQQLDDQVGTWLASDVGLVIDPDNGTVSVSAIFDWFGDDWTTTYSPESGFTGSEVQKAVLNFISGYLDPEAAAYLQQGDYQLTYLDYDWSLNQQ
ncbi:MAG: DUF547 domain-containing protein [Leptolyngbyaceae bacterium]|nr:DUF547 domain-containing protein [Leptolyngbyaceae bacterium]